MSKKYQESGVSLERGYESVNRIKKYTKQTFNQGVMSDIGSFGGLFDLENYNIKHPVLVSGTDGVGTKLLVAQEANIHSTIGIDLVAMCVNDIITSGAKPLFFLDYIATGKVQPEIIEEIIKGISAGCKEAGAALIGGETAEMPGMYSEGHYDLAGYSTGVVDKEKIVSNEGMKENQVIIGLESSGIHSNGYSLVRKIFFQDHQYQLDEYIEDLGCDLKTELLKPTKIYVKGILDLLSKVKIHGIAHITGGGFIENIPRTMKAGYTFRIHKNQVPVKPIFKIMQNLAQIEEDEMYNIFNMGIGMIIIVDIEQLEESLSILHQYDYKPHIIGKVIASDKWELVK